MRRRGEPGVTSVEFALVSIAFFFLLIGIFEVGRLLYGLSTMTNAAREGARYGVASANTLGGHTTACDNTTPGLKGKVRSVASGIPFPDANIAPVTNVDGSGRPVSCTVTLTWAYTPASGFFNVMRPHTFTTSSTLYFQNNLQ